MLINYPNCVTQDAQSQRREYQIVYTNPITYTRLTLYEIKQGNLNTLNNISLFFTKRT
jgi:hypothetical protein